MQVRLNDREMEALQGLPWFARCLYVFGIRPYMDYRTGTVGIVRGVSWQSIAEALYVEPHQGETDSGTPDKSRVRRAAARLEKAGLIALRSMDKRLVFQCLLADTDQSAPNKPDTNPTQTRHSEADTANPNDGASFQAEPDTNPTHPEPAEPDTPPVSGIRKKNTNPYGFVVASAADDGQAPCAGDGVNQKKSNPPPACPHQDIIDLYHEILPELPRVKVWDKQRQGFLRARWREDAKRQNLDWWRRFFTAVRTSPWLMGQVPGREGRVFVCTLEWLIRPTNFRKVIEGYYADRRAA